MKKYDFSELLRIQMNFVAGWIGSNGIEAIKLEKALDAMTNKERIAFAEYKNAYYDTEILKNGFGYNIIRR